MDKDLEDLLKAYQWFRRNIAHFLADALLHIIQFLKQLPNFSDLEKELLEAGEKAQQEAEMIEYGGPGWGI